MIGGHLYGFDEGMNDADIKFNINVVNDRNVVISYVMGHRELLYMELKALDK